MMICNRLHKGTLAMALVVVLLSQVSMEVGASNVIYALPNTHQTTTVSFEVIPDPYLQTGVELHNHGTSNEFNASHVQTGGIDSHVNLTWNHVAGIELTLTSAELPFTTQRNDFPYYWDFCYFTVSFPWNLERLPTDAMFRFSYGVHTDDDFNTTDGESMFNVHAWLIDSSDNWEPLYESEPPYSTTIHLYTYDLNYFDLHSGWRGMVRDDSGNQEDPEDILRVGVGLAPSEDFDTHDETHPWQEYNGRVMVIVNTLSLSVLLEPEETGVPVEQYYFIGAPIGIAAVVLVVYLMWRRRYRNNQVRTN